MLVPTKFFASAGWSGYDPFFTSTFSSSDWPQHNGVAAQCWGGEIKNTYNLLPTYSLLIAYIIERLKNVFEKKPLTLYILNYLFNNF